MKNLLEKLKRKKNTRNQKRKQKQFLLKLKKKITKVYIIQKYC